MFPIVLLAARRLAALLDRPVHRLLHHGDAGHGVLDERAAQAELLEGGVLLGGEVALLGDLLGQGLAGQPGLLDDPVWEPGLGRRSSALSEGRGRV